MRKGKRPMLKKLKENWFPVLACALSLTAALFWVALRVNYSGISKFLGADTNPSFIVMNLPLIVCGFSWAGFTFSLLGLNRWKKQRWIAAVGFVIGLICAVGAGVVVYFGAWDYLRFIMVHFWKSAAVAAVLMGLACLLFFPMTGQTKGVTAAKWAILGAAAAAAIVLGYQLRPCTFTYGAVVYAVEDEYQIVFSTSDSAMAWVSIDGQEYYDLYAGSARSIDRVHKVTVPQTALDEAGAYTIYAQQMIYRGPFGGYKGEVMSQDYAFRGVDTSDGIDYVSLSDVHEAVDAATKAATAGETPDFIVLLGDLVSMVETEADAQLANELAHAITGGECPVIYARGNHEVKGEYSEVLYKYVGSKNQSYAYGVSLGGGDVFVAVMDLGEDHADDWWEYYGTAQFDVYRVEQTEMLREMLASGAHEGSKYQMLLCHIPVVYVDRHGYYEEFRREWTALLNEMGTDIGLSGHKHKVLYFLPGTLTPGETLVYSEAYAGQVGKKEGGTVADFAFPNFLVGQRSLAQLGGTQQWGTTDYLCLHTHVDLDTGMQNSCYYNSKGEKVTVVYPFETDKPVEAGEEIASTLR